MQPQDGLPGPSALSQGTLTSLKHSSLGNASQRGLHARGPMTGFRSTGGRLMVAVRAASVGLRCSRAALLPAWPHLAAMAFSAQPSSVPKPGFAPGAPGTTPPPPGTAPAASAAPAAKAGSASTASAGIGSSSGGAAAAIPARSSRSSPLGWAIPILGLPLLAAYYNYQKEYDKAWDEKVDKLMQEFMAERRAPQRTISVPQMPPQVAAPPPRQPPAPAPAPPAPSPPAALADSGKEVQGRLAPAVAPVPPLVASESAASPPPTPPPAPPPAEAPAPVAPASAAPPPPSDTEAAGAILKATQAAQAETPAPPADIPSAAAAVAGPPAAAPQAHDKPAAPLPAPEPVPAPTPSPEAAIAMASAAALAMLQTGAAPSAPLPPDLPPGQLGLEGRDLSPLGLIKAAVSSAGTQVVDWSQWPERHAQAVADSRLLFEALSAAAKWHEEEMAKVRGEVAAAVQLSEQLQSAGEGAVQRFKELLKQVVESSKEMLELEVRQAEKRTRLECEKARVSDAIQRGGQLEQLRLAVGALGLAHEARVRQAAAAQTGHVLAAGAAAVASAAESGVPLGAAAAALRGVAGSDPLVGSVVAALPEGPVATRSELLQQFRRLRSDLSALSLLPGERAGIAAVALARLAAKIKVDEAQAVKVLGTQYGSGGVDAALARTEALLTEGQLPGAVELLSAALHGTAAAALAMDWLDSVRQRAAVEASVAALNAHAAAIWASLAV